MPLSGRRDIILSWLAFPETRTFPDVVRTAWSTTGCIQKICARCVPKNFTDDDKARRIVLSVMHLARYADQGSKFLQCIVIGDATWIIHAVRETKQKKNPWLPNNRHFLLQKKNQSSGVSKVMATVFWDHKGVFIPYFIDRSDTANVERYCNTQGGFGRSSVAKGLGDSAKA